MGPDDAERAGRPMGPSATETWRLRLVPGTRLGPYEILGLLGAGGMGEVYRARDIRLGREVAIKVLPERVAGDAERQRRFEREARAIAALNHPHVLTIHDVGTHDGTAYVVTELLEGSTVREIQERGTLSPRQATVYLLQAARGLGAAHHKGIVHRDLKPENLFLTSDGRIKVLDFGLARLRNEGPIDGATPAPGTDVGKVMGTAAYMSPEQVRAEPLDPRSDVFSLGVVMRELLAREHPFKRETLAATLAAIIHEIPAPLETRGLPPGIAAIVARCLSKQKEDRFASGDELGDALQAALGGTGSGGLALGLQERGPYPGLEPFREKDAEVYFGREEEVEALGEKLVRRKLLAVIGPSGAGKTSFVRAGVLASCPRGWGTALCTPGTNPTLGLAQALTRELLGDAEAISDLLRGVTEHVQDGEAERVVQAGSRWRRRHDEVLLVVDQMEELFTLNPPVTQVRFPSLLARLATEADVHVLLALRDDFLVRSQEQPPLREVASDLTILLPLSPEGLRRALTEPARQRGYNFEDEALVEEMVEAVKDERAALPLVAFAVARLWERRDQERKLLTREAYDTIGGVAGALARHAEATIERIGPQKTPLVREAFRSLVTAQGTRVVRERAELLSVFESPLREEAEAVLDALVAARLLTSYERTDETGQAHPQVEIVHESLLRAWPRLVRWQTQDADSVQLRDQLRQAAQLWHDRGRSDDLLWSGSAYRDLALWQERYRGGLTSTEQAFTAAARRRDGRRRGWRRLAASTVLIVATAVAFATSVLWRRAESARWSAEAQARQREAAQLVSLGRLRLGDHPSATLAHAIASLERADNAPARRLAVEALWKAPPHVETGGAAAMTSRWSADGRWLALGSWTGLTLLDRDTGRRHLLGKSGEHPGDFSADGTRLLSGSQAAASELHLWSLPEARLLETWPPAERRAAFLRGRRLLTFLFDDPIAARVRSVTVQERSIEGGPEKPIGRWQPRGLVDWTIDPAGDRLFSLQEGRLVEQRLDALSAPPRVLGRHDGAIWISEVGSGRVLTMARGGDLRIWDTVTGRVWRTLPGHPQTRRAFLDPSGLFVVATPSGPGPPGPLLVFELEGPPTAEPVRLVENTWGGNLTIALDPRRSWLSTGQGLFNLAARRPTVLRGQRGPAIGVTFTPDGRLVSTSDEGVVRLFGLTPAAGAPVREVWAERPSLGGVARNIVVGYFVEADPRSRFVVFGARFGGRVFVQPLDGSRARDFRLRGLRPTAADPHVDPRGERVALASLEFGNPKETSIRVLDLASGGERILRAEETAGACARSLARVGPLDVPTWLPDGRLVSDGVTGLRLWDLAEGKSRQLRPCRPSWDAERSVPGGARVNAPSVRATPDGRALVTLLGGADMESDLSVADLETGVSRDITSHGGRLRVMALDPTGQVLVTGDVDGLVRVGALTGEEPHLLFGHTQPVTSVAVSPDGKWVASGSDDETIRLWPMPAGQPLHTLPLEELLAKLRSLTNLRVLPDANSATDYKVEPGPLPSLAKAPEW